MKKIDWQKMYQEILPSTHIARFCRSYLDKYNHYNWDMRLNGEFELLENLIDFNFETFFDVGANTGEWTIEAHSKFPNTKIHCFELSHSTYDILKNRLEKKTNVTLNNKGLSNKEGIVKYKDYGTGSGITSLIVDFDKFDRNHEYKIVEGYCILGDHYCEINKISEIDLLKIDVEGAENLVLEGFKNMLKNQKIKIIQFEYGYPNGDAHFLMKDFYKYLNKFGYIIGKLRPGGVQFQKFSYNLNDFKSGPNFIAVLEKEEKIIKKIRY